MQLSLLSVFLGVVLGALAASIAWHLSTRQVRNPETTHLTTVWQLSDIIAPGTKPAIMAQRVDGMKFPAGSHVILQKGQLDSVAPEVLTSCEVRVHDDVRVNAAVGRDRALVFSGHVSPRAVTVMTLDAQLVRRLQADFTRMWGQSEPYVETARIAELAAMEGRLVDVTGRASDLMEYRGRRMLRITDGRTSIGVVTTQEDVARHQGKTVRIVGRVVRENGEAYVEADAIRDTQGAVAMPAVQ